MVIEGVVTTEGVEGGKLWKPSNYKKVAGNSWAPRESLDYLLRGDWIPAIKEYHIYQENVRWWEDYKKNTGVSKIVYPYRSGYYNQTSGENFISSFSVSKNLMRLYK